MSEVIKKEKSKIEKMKRREASRKLKEREKGFTLVEVILVVAIITIISAIAVPQVGKYLNKANRSKVILIEHGNLNKLGIGLDSNGKFKIGNIEGNVVYQDGEVFAKVAAGSKAFAGEEIRK